LNERLEGEFLGGDVIVAVNGVKIDSVSRLLATLDDYQIGAIAADRSAIARNPAEQIG
jgi:S1-C subfamily serine protease